MAAHSFENSSLLPSLLPLGFSAMHMAHQNYNETAKFVIYCVLINVLAVTFRSTGLLISWLFVAPALLFTVVGTVCSMYGAAYYQTPSRQHTQESWFYGF